MTIMHAAVAALALVSLGCDSAEPCSAKGCFSGATFVTRFESTIDKPTTAAVRVCRNDECASGDITMTRAAATGPIEGNFPLLDVGGNSMSRVAVSLSNSDGDLMMKVSWRDPNNTAVRDGDVYRVEVRDMAGAWQLAFTETVVAYVDNRPNGPACAPLCRSVSIDRRFKTN
jgi:hypothetical protein